MDESGKNILNESVIVNKWVQRLMYTIQTEPQVHFRTDENSDEYTEIQEDLKTARVCLSHAVRIVDNMVRKSHPACGK